MLYLACVAAASELTITHEVDNATILSRSDTALSNALSKLTCRISSCLWCLFVHAPWADELMVELVRQVERPTGRDVI